MESPDRNGELFVRPMEPGDADAVSRLIEQLGYSRSPQEVLEWIAGVGAGDRQAAFVACQAGEVVGWIEVAIERRLQYVPFALVGGLVVQEGLRGQGIGRLLCRHAEEWAWEHGAEKVRVTSRSTRVDAHRFYVRDGYQPVKTSMVFEKTRSS